MTDYSIRSVAVVLLVVALLIGGAAATGANTTGNLTDTNTTVSNTTTETSGSNVSSSVETTNTTNTTDSTASTQSPTVDNETNTTNTTTSSSLTESTNQSELTNTSTETNTTSEPVEDSESEPSAGENQTTDPVQSGPVEPSEAVSGQPTPESAVGGGLQKQLSQNGQQGITPNGGNTSGGASESTTDDSTLQESVSVIVEADRGNVQAATAVVEANGGTVTETYDGKIVAELSPAAVSEVGAAEAVELVRQPATPTTMTVSEGVGWTNADQIHNSDINASNVTVAIYDTKFNPDNPDIKDQVIETRGDSSNFKSGTEGLHGTATAEIVADMAPEANLILVSTPTEADLYTQTDYIQNETETDIISMSLGWYPEVGPLDGTDSISQRLAEASDSGITVVTSAGNENENTQLDGVGNHWNGTFNDHDDDDFMEFANGDEALPVEYTWDGSVYVTWDSWDDSTQDYTIHILNDTKHIVNSQNTNQPVEKFDISTSGSGTFYVAIENSGADGTQDFDIFTTGYMGMPDYTESRSITIPATAPETVTVAAVRDNAGELAGYSSPGPTIDGRRGIDLAAPTNVTTESYDDTYIEQFTGTSASAPHVAGGFALLEEINPSANRSEKFEAIKQTATDISDPDVAAPPNPDIGVGHLDIQAAADTLPAANISQLNISQQGSDATIDAGDESNISVVVNNTGGVQGTFDLTLHFNESYTLSRTTPALSTNENQTITFTNVTGNLTANTYTIEAKSLRQDSTTGTLTVETPTPAAFRTEISHAPTAHDRVGTAVAGTEVPLEYNVTNTGDLSGSQTVSVSYAGSTIDTQTISLDTGESVTKTVNGSVTTADTPSISPTVASDDTTNSTTITVTDTPGDVDTVNITEARTAVNDTATVNAVFNDTFGVESVDVGLSADFTSFSTDTAATNHSPTYNGSITASEIASAGDGDYTAYAVITDRGGNTRTVTNTSQVVTFDTTNPTVQLNFSNLGDDPATLGVEADEKVNITDVAITADGNPRTLDSPNPDSYLTSDTFEFDGSTVGDETNYSVTVTAADTAGNTHTQTVASSVVGYEIANESAQVTPSTTETGFNLSVDSSVTDTDRNATVYESATPPAGTETSADEVTGTFFQVNDIGLSDSELEQATIQIPLSEVDIEDVSNDELVILFSDDNGGYEPIETKIVNGNLTANVTGFSGGAPGVVDNDPPSIDSSSVDTGTTVDPTTTDTANVTFEYSPVISDINTTATSVSVSGHTGSSNKQVTNETATVNLTGLTDGDTIDVDLSVIDDAGNEATDTVTISVTTNPSNNNDDGETTDTGGGGGGGQGGGGGGGGGGEPETGPPTMSEVRSTLNFVPTTATAQTDISGTTAEPAGSETVSQIQFENSEVSGSVSVTDYGSPPSTFAEEVVESASSDGVDIEQSDTIVSFSEVKTTIPATVDKASTVELTVDADRVENPDNLVVVKEKYDFDEQRDLWEAKPTRVKSTDEGTITLVSEFEKFSMVAVVEREQTEDTSDGSDQEASETEDSTPLPLSIPVIALLSVAIYLSRD